jgi:hypothetical protein
MPQIVVRVLVWAVVLMVDVAVTTKLFLATNHWNDEFVSRLTNSVDNRNKAWFARNFQNGNYERYPYISPGECLFHFGVFFSYAVPSLVVFTVVYRDRRIWITFGWTFVVVTFAAYMILLIPYTITQDKDQFSTVMDVAFSVIAVGVAIVLFSKSTYHRFEADLEAFRDQIKQYAIERAAKRNIAIKSLETDLKSSTQKKYELVPNDEV